MSDEPHPPSSEQLALLHAAARLSARAGASTTPEPDVAQEGAQGLVAVVWPMLDVPHLDREFEYLVPPAMSEEVQFGVAVKVRFSGRQITGYVVAVREQAEFSGTLKPLERVISPEPVLTPHVWKLAQRVAAFDGGTVSDVLRLAIPPRHARAEKAHSERRPVHGPARGPQLWVNDEAPAWHRYGGGPALLRHIAAGEGPGASWDAAPGVFGPDAWPMALAELAAAARAGGRGSVIVVPDARDVDRVFAACTEHLGADRVVRLSADQGPQARYTAYLSALRGDADVVVGTRAAMFAPVHDVGLLVWWDDVDPLHADPHAPYPHVRDVLRIRAELSGAALVSAGFTRSATMQSWIERGLFKPLDPLKRTSAHVVVTGDDRSVERHGPAARARIPAEAWRGAREALEHGPVLVQVPRRGYLPALACAQCRTKATCPVCHGPLGHDAVDGPPSCRWCGHVAHVVTCAECGSHQLRSLVIGAGRTAEELGRAFPGVPVRRSGAPDVIDEVADEPTLVICTPGAEPVAPAGYRAALLLDAWALLDRPGLDAAARAFNHWATAAALVRPGGQEPDGGRVFLCGVPRHVPFPPVEALVRWAPRWFAERELHDRVEAQLPPAVAMAALEGPRRAAQAMAQEVEAQAQRHGLDLTVLGPLPLGRRHAFDRAVPSPVKGEGDEPVVRYLARWADRFEIAPAKLLRTVRAERAARREPAVTVRLDPLLDGLG